MERNSAYENSWADQWDYNNTEPYSKDTKKSNSGGGGGRVAKKVGEKTKAVASTSMKKVKEGTSSGFQWIKDKFQKTTQKH
ncbi:hypothetical protein A4A49_30849 [Nicotiana attenuata]|uniref:Uncharacterized protein n=1 Tax=Nicotiana attenuata TaxID=49451 RepID=A0A314KPG1_NICAT|nr:hypothetical protein A4A49_30849 [Nicotiana attenuata]